MTDPSIAYWKARAEALEKRLEYRLADGSIAPADGIACRDETIRQQDARIDELRAENAKLRRAYTAEFLRCAPLIDAAITWAYCPAAGAYEYTDDDEGDYSMEGTCEALGEAVRHYTGLDEPAPSDKRWTHAEMRAAVEAAIAAQKEKK